MRKLLDNKVFKIIYGTLKFIFFAVIILYLIFIAYQRLVKTDVAGYRIYTVSSNSMYPVYEIGDVILIKKTDNDKLKINDIVTYTGKVQDMSGLTITHRIIDMHLDESGKKAIITKGDANDAADPSIRYEQILGVAQYKFKLFSLITKAIKNKYIFFFCAFVPLVLVLFLEVADSVTELKEVKDSGKESKHGNKE